MSERKADVLGFVVFLSLGVALRLTPLPVADVVFRVLMTSLATYFVGAVCGLWDVPLSPRRGE